MNFIKIYLYGTFYAIGVNTVVWVDGEDKIEIENMMNEKEIEKDKFAKYILEMLQTMIDDIIKKIDEEKAQ